MIVSTLKRLRSLSACPKKTSVIISSWDITFQRILTFDWLTAFLPKFEDPEFSQIWDWRWNIKKNIIFHFRLFPGSANDKMFQKILKNLSLVKKGFSWETEPGQFFNYSNWLPLSQVSVKTNASFLRKMPTWLADRQWWFYSTLRRTGVRLLK